MRDTSRDGTSLERAAARRRLRDRDLAGRLTVVMAQLANLLDTTRTASPASCARFHRGVIDVEAFIRQLYDQISDLNAVWIHERMISPDTASANAWAAFVALGQQQELKAFLEIASCVDVEAIRRPCLLIAALLSSTTGVHDD